MSENLYVELSDRSKQIFKSVVDIFLETGSPSGSETILKKGGISAIECEIMFDNVYSRYLTFSDVEKNLIKNNYRFSGIETCNNNLFENILFFGDLLYIHKKILKSHIKNS